MGANSQQGVALLVFLLSFTFLSIAMFFDGNVVAFLAAVALVLVGVFKLFHMIARRIRQHSLRFGALLLAACLLLDLEHLRQSRDQQVCIA